MRIIYILILFSFLAACTPRISKTLENKAKDNLDFSQPPTWAREAIWYQIFVERFRNGNPKNNPTLETCKGALMDPMPNDWTLTPWGHNWYQQEEWAEKTGLDFYRTIQMRRYGGDLDGVLEKINYLVDLGITAVYFNPLNDAPSLHKYDARSYHHIDVTFGDDIENDKKIIASETPDDPNTWKWTSADKKFLEIISILHSNGIKVVLDFSWNHTGSTFWAFEDVANNREDSKFKNWYHVKLDPEKRNEPFEYEGWYGIKTLPELRKVDTEGKIAGHPYNGNLDPDVKSHIYDVCHRWMDPRGDGSCIGGIDGMRLDVAEHVPVGFWREFRAKVRGLNPEFYLVGENWWTQWPDQLMDPAPWVKGDIFDAVMHYQWFKGAHQFFAQPMDSSTTAEFRHYIDSVFQKYPVHTQQAMMNLSSSHDSPRLLTQMFNHNKYKVNCKPQEDGQYRTNPPGLKTMKQTQLLLLHQYTFVGAPHIWNGDEMGMVGADDPDNRKPLVWPDIKFEQETQSKSSSYKYKTTPKFDVEMHAYYKSLIKLRKNHKSLTYGDYQWKEVSQENGLCAYTRNLDEESILVVINNSNQSQRFSTQEFTYDVKHILFRVGQPIGFEDQEWIMPAYSGIVYKL
jgi:cyclomaltodextrinase / maltogenic alpha-amylase / neopullulanase